jgi:hypothetical protein
MHAASGAWVPEVSSIRVVVKIPASIYPELMADLAKVDLRDRAERLRMLAMLGLRDSQHHSPPPQGEPETTPQAPPASGSVTQASSQQADSEPDAEFVKPFQVAMRDLRCN